MAAPFVIKPIDQGKLLEVQYPPELAQPTVWRRFSPRSLSETIQLERYDRFRLRYSSQPAENEPCKVDSTDQQSGQIDPNGVADEFT